MGELANRLSGLQGLHRELMWDAKHEDYPISPIDKIKLLT
jgi:hypothetical protein